MIFPFAKIFKVITSLIVFASSLSLSITNSPALLIDNTNTNIVENVQSEAFETQYDGYVCFLQKNGKDVIDVYIKPNEDCALQAFDIYLDTDNNDFEVISHTGKNIDVIPGHFNLQSIANGLEMEMKANENYKIASITLPIKNSDYEVRVIRADLAIAHTPDSPSMDDRYLELDPIIIN